MMIFRQSSFKPLIDEPLNANHWHTVDCLRLVTWWSQVDNAIVLKSPRHTVKRPSYITLSGCDTATDIGINTHTASCTVDAVMRSSSTLTDLLHTIIQLVDQLLIVECFSWFNYMTTSVITPLLLHNIDTGWGPMHVYWTWNEWVLSIECIEYSLHLYWAWCVMSIRLLKERLGLAEGLDRDVDVFGIQGCDPQRQCHTIRHELHCCWLHYLWYYFRLNVQLLDIMHSVLVRVTAWLILEAEHVHSLVPWLCLQDDYHKSPPAPPAFARTWISDDCSAAMLLLLLLLLPDHPQRTAACKCSCYIMLCWSSWGTPW